MRAKKYGKHDKSNPPKKSRNRLMLIIVLCLIALVAVEVVALMSITNVDRRITRSIQRGLYDGWSLNKTELQLQETGRITDTGFIEAERSAISEYINKKYKDDELGHLVNEYIFALNKCHNAAMRYDPAKDYDGFWSLFSEPYGRRVKALYEMYNGDYDLELDDPEHEEELANLLAQGWLLDTIENLSFNNSDKDGIRTFKTMIRNDSGSDIEYLNLDIELLDKEGKVVETSSVYLTDIKDGLMMPLRFISTSEKAVKYRIVSETVRFRNSAYSVQEVQK